MDTTTIETIRTAVENINDPDLQRTLGQLKAVFDIKEVDGTVEVYLEIVPPVYDVAEYLDTAVKQAVASAANGANAVVIAREKEIKRTGNAHVLPDVHNLIAVASGKGGVGKSTVAANLACALAQHGLRVGLLDADIYGPSAPTMFGLAGATMHAEKTEDGRILGYPNEQYGVKVASIGFVMQRDQAAILRGPMLAGYFKTLVEQIQWGELDVLLFDLPPGTGDIQLTLTQQVPLTGAVVVTTPQEIALADVRRSVQMFRKVNVEILGVVENMSYFVPPDAPEKKYHIFGEGGGAMVASEAGVPLLGEIPINIGLRTGGDDGLPAVLNPDMDYEIAKTIHTVAANVIRQVRIVNARRLDAPVIQITL
ncbi:MAG: P-loop NTPase [Candidatus Kapabacteria bacterium]|nr:P-loop NTPase [Candidatus Kapabacteria bacterium]